MENIKIVSKVNSFLHESAKLLAQWLTLNLSQTSTNWWEDCVIDKLSFSQKEIANKKAFSKLNDFDLSALLRIADKSWYEMRSVIYLPSNERENIKEMMKVRNNWAHCSANLPGKDKVLSDLNTILEFLKQMNCEFSLLTDVEEVIESIISSSDNKFEEILNLATTSENPLNPTQLTVESDNIKEQNLVYIVGDPSVQGVVMSIADLGLTKKYTVFISGSMQTYYSDQIELVCEEDKYTWLSIDEFKSRLTAYQINNPSCKDLYSLNSARIDFVPYQFRPALKLIQADEPRILIADSVGVGKTIEAGIIIKELEARKELENILIICPKALVAERKWELEMKRFDEDFIPVDGKTLRQIISDTNRDGVWPNRYSKAIIPFSALDGETYDGANNTRKKSFGLIDLDPPPHFDLVIIDEAHHLRNGSMEKEKSFAYKCIKQFCDNADSVIMLTATPLQTSDNDLFTLLNLLRPDLIIDKETFDVMSKPNASLSKCSKIIRKAGSYWQDEAIDELKKVIETQWGENVIALNPVFNNVVQSLKKKDLAREERVELITDIESLHSFNSMLNRTRRKDIQDFCVRRSHTIEVNFTEEQEELHKDLLKFEMEALLELHRNSRSIPFMMSTIRRLAASSIFGLAPYIKDIIERRFSQLSDDYDEDLTELNLDTNMTFAIDMLAKRLLEKVDNLSSEDPKFEEVYKIICEKQNMENNKIILFSTFRYTLHYLEKKLLSRGLRVAQINGSIKDEVRRDLRMKFELSKDNDDAIDIMLFTEVGSEGLDYQFCDTMINYDLPWNPMKIEQRIGRIDRRGQKSEVVNIYNIITNNTVDADIYYRCLMRIGVFERSIGECEEILGDIADKIVKITIDTTLTDAERKVKLEQMADNEIRKLNELSKLEDSQKDLFGFNISEYITSQEIQKAENQWLNQNNLQLLIKQYLSECLGEGDYFFGKSDSEQIRLNIASRNILLKEYRKMSLSKNSASSKWEAYLKGNKPTQKITFDAQIAKNSAESLFVTPMHPLTKQASKHFATNEKSYIYFEYSSETIPKGEYYFSVYAWNYIGVNPGFETVAVSDNKIIENELFEILQEASTGSFKSKINYSIWDELEKAHVDKWIDCKEKHIAKAKSTADFKLNSIGNNFNNRKRSLEQKINDSDDENIKRMRTSQLETATESYNEKLREITEELAQTDIHVTLIANGIIEIR